MRQLELFAASPQAIADEARRILGRAMPPSVPTDTSEAAAAKISRQSRCRYDEAMLLQWLQERGEIGATDEEIRNKFGWSGDYERPRRWRWSKQGTILDSGMRWRNKSGNLMIVWVAAHFQNVDGGVY